MKKLFFIVLTTLSYSISAQQITGISFLESTHDFGTIKEENGPAEFEFVFKNNGTKPLKILNVKASCGCTTPIWTKDEVVPGAKGVIKASYNPLNRPGPFHKTITVTTSDSTNSSIVLRINGQVKPKPRTIETDLPTLLGGIRVKYKAFNLGKVFNNKTITQEFDVYNALDRPIVFSKEIEGPAYISITFIPEKLAPKGKGKIAVTYDAKAKNDLGFMSDNVVITTNEEGDAARKSISVYADLNEFFPAMSVEELATAAHLEIPEVLHDFGSIDSGVVVETVFVLTNSGNSNLNIRKTNSSCGCTVAQLNKMDIKPGESMDMKVTFNSTGRKGNQIKTVTIYSNDPSKPIQKVTIKANIAI